MPSTQNGFAAKSALLASLLAAAGALALAHVVTTSVDDLGSSLSRNAEMPEVFSLLILLPALLFHRRIRLWLQACLLHSGVLKTVLQTDGDRMTSRIRKPASATSCLLAASHELRQPLRAIHIFINALRNTELNEEQRRIVKYLEGSGHSLAHVIDTLIDMAKLEDGLLQARPLTTDARAIFRRIREELVPLAVDKGLRLRVVLPCRELALRTDPNLLLVILRNLVGNAIKYTDRGGVLLVARVRRDCFALQVWDTGCGIPAEYLPRIYDEFFRIADTRHEDGLGLGLSIVRRLADQLDYELDCRSRAGRGTLFEVRIPRIELPATAIRPTFLRAQSRSDDTVMI